MIIDRFDQGAAERPQRVFVKSSTISITYEEAERDSHAIAHALRQAGLGARHIGLLSPNDAHAMVAIIGIVRSGATYVPLNAADSIESIAAFMEAADVAALVCHESYRSHIEEFRQRLPHLEFVAGLTGEIEPAGPSLSGWIGQYSGKRVGRHASADDIAIIKSSGGTTGKPKAIIQTHRALDVTYRIMNQFCRPANDPVHLIVAPVTHAAGATALALAQFATTNIIAQARDPGSILDAMVRERVTHIFVPPTLIYRMLAHPKARTVELPALEYIVYGAAPMSSEKLQEGLNLWGPVFLQTYGQAEVPGVITCLSRQDHIVGDSEEAARRLASAGRPTGACEVALMLDNGSISPLGEAGEIVVRGELVTPGYYKNPEANEEVHAFGWHHTGDIGVFDDNGYLYIVDRKKDMIISGGFNIYPSELEQIIWGHSGVQDCAVVGVPDPDWGERVTAVVELKKGETVSAEEIVELCKTRLGSLKTPKAVVFWESLPRSAVGKVLKKDIRARLAEAEL